MTVLRYRCPRYVVRYSATLRIAVVLLSFMPAVVVQKRLVDEGKSGMLFTYCSFENAQHRVTADDFIYGRYCAKGKKNKQQSIVKV